jgi:hypothetical protein
VAALQHRLEGVGKAGGDAEPLGPGVGDRGEAGVGGGAQVGNEGRQRIREVAVLAAPEAVPGHDDAAAEPVRRVIEGRRRCALARRQQARQVGVARLVEGCLDGRPVHVRKAVCDGVGHQVITLGAVRRLRIPFLDALDLEPWNCSKPL